jgi:predicted GNAT family acetyltransferase
MMHIEHDFEHHQFVTVIDGFTATLKYGEHPDQKTLDFYSTFVPPELRNRGIAGELVKYALDYAIKNGYLVIPSCSFVKAYVNSHSEYEKALK